MGEENVAKVVEDNDDAVKAFSPLDDMVKELDGPDLEGDLEEGDVTTEPEDKASEDEDGGDESQKVAEEEAASDGEADEGAEEEEEAPVEDEVDPRDAEIASLRAKTREQEQDLRALRKQSEEINRKLTESGLVKDEEQDEEQSELDAAYQVKLETLAETMKVNPQYADLDEVVTEDRYNDTIEGAVAKLVDDGYSKDEAYDLANSYVWTRPNPYKYLYTLIKDGHPDFKKDEAAGGEAEGSEDKDKAKDKKQGKKKEVAPSINNAPGGGGKDKGGWTAARIDDLPEGRLNEVPTDVYNKYLAGELD